jgi:sugar/nucleoside kinase (ribokinase family)
MTDNNFAPFIVCIGEALVDFIAEQTVKDVGRASTFIKAPGGAVANTAVGLARLGVNSRFVGKVGGDPFGRFLQDTMAEEGVDVSFFIESKRYPTALVFVALDESRVPRFIFFGDPSADMMLMEDEIWPTMLEDAAFLHLGTVSMVREPVRGATFKLMGMAREQGVKICFDPNFRLHLWKDHELLKELAKRTAADATVVKLNDEELLFMTGEKSLEKGARRVRDRGAELVVVTLGPQGAYYLCEDGDGEVPGFKVYVADTTGAGDGFAAGLLAAMVELEEWPPAAESLYRAVRFANAVGAMVCTKVGAQSSLPGRSDVDSFMAENQGGS